MKKSNYTIGLDLSDRKVTICILDTQGCIHQELTEANRQETYEDLARDYPGDRATHPGWPG